MLSEPVQRWKRKRGGTRRGEPAHSGAASPAEKTLSVGPNLQFVVPGGCFNLGLHLRQEWNHEAALGKFAEIKTLKGRDSSGGKNRRCAPICRWTPARFCSTGRS
jgi:hypothetical protein